MGHPIQFIRKGAITLDNMQRGTRSASPSRPTQDKAPTSLPVMAYVPVQQLNTVYDTDKALERGTLFPELDKPWLGGAAR